jgi:cytochrome P450
MIVFFAAMLIRPEVQTMVQKELDSVTGRERLPTFEDRPRLPLVDAICREVLRWRPVTPLGELMLPAARPPKRSHGARSHRPCSHRR